MHSETHYFLWNYLKCTTDLIIKKSFRLPWNDQLIWTERFSVDENIIIGDVIDKFGMKYVEKLYWKRQQKYIKYATQNKQ